MYSPRHFHYLAIAALTVPSLTAHAQTAPDIYAVTNAHIVTGNGKKLEHGTLVVRDGLIVAVGEKIVPPKDATLVDGSNVTLYPGFIDGFSHLGMPAASDYPTPRGETYRIAKVRSDMAASSLFKPDAAALEQRRKLGFGAMLVAPNVGIFTGTSAVFSLSGTDDSRTALIAPTVGMHIDWTAPDAGFGYPSSLMGKIAATRQALIDAQTADNLLSSYSRNPQGRPRPSIPPAISALIPVVQGKLPVVFHADTALNILRVVKLCREFRIRPIIEGGIEAYRVAAELKKAEATVLLTMSLPNPPKPASKGDADSLDGQNTLQSLRYRANAPKTAVALYKSGVPFVLTTAGLDSPANYVTNVRRLIAAGLPEEKAIEALTVAPARLFGIERQLGTLEVGKIANVVAVAGGTPFDGKGKIQFVFVDGKQLEVDAGKPKTIAAKPSSNFALPPGVTREQALDTLKNQPDIARPFLPPGVTIEMAIASLEGNGATSAPNADDKKEEDTKIPVIPEVGTGLIPPLPPSLPSSFVLRGATVWTSASMGILPTADVFVSNGKIVKLGINLSVPKGTLEIPAQGKHVTPGMIDCHSHTAIDGGVNEGTNSITAECRVEDVIDSDDVNIYRELAGGTTAANMLHGSANAIGGQNAVVKWRWGKTPEEMLLKGALPGIKFALGENPKRSNFVIPGRERRFPTTRLGVEKVIRDAFQRAKDYKTALAAYSAGKIPVPPARDLQTETIVELLDGKRVIHSHCYRQDEILMLIRLAQEYGIRIATLQHVLEGYKVADEMASAGIGGSTFSDWWGYKIEAYDAIPYNAALMAERGVVVSFNSDSDELARRLNLEAAKGVRYGGMSRTEALKAVTINPAKQLGIDKMTGRLEEGKDADIVVWSGDPLSTQTVCEKTFVDGQLNFDRAADLAARATLAEEKRRLIAAEAPPKKDSPASPGSAPKPKATTATIYPKLVPLAQKPTSEYAPVTGKGDARPVAGTMTAIVGATVHTVSGANIPNGIVLIQGGKIQAVGTPDVVKVPEGATIFKADGLHVYPGLMDSNTTIGINEIESVRATTDVSEAGEFNPELHTIIAVNPDSERIGVVRQAGILTVATVPNGGIISGMGAVLNTDGWTWEDMAVKTDAGIFINFPTMGFRRFSEARHKCDDETEDYESDNLRAGGSILLLQPPGRPGAASGGDEENPQLKALDTFLASARRYQTARKANDSKLPPLPVDPKLEAMLPVLEGRVPLFIRADTQKDIKSAVEWTKKNNLKMVLLGGQEADKCADVLVKSSVPLIFGPVLNLPRLEDSPYDDIYALPGVLSRAGVKVSLTSGTDGDGEETHRLAHQAAMAAAFGLSPDEAIKGITLYPAQAYGVADRLGSIEVGKDATLLVTTGDILELTSDIKAAWIKGLPTNLTNKHTRLYEKYKSRPKK